MPLDDITLDDLRRRRSYKWVAYPPDVLPSSWPRWIFGTMAKPPVILEQIVERMAATVR